MRCAHSNCAQPSSAESSSAGNADFGSSANRNTPRRAASGVGDKLTGTAKRSSSYGPVNGSNSSAVVPCHVRGVLRDPPIHANPVPRSATARFISINCSPVKNVAGMSPITMRSNRSNSSRVRGSRAIGVLPSCAKSRSAESNITELSIVCSLCNRFLR